MKTLRDFKLWKILIGVIVGIAVVSIAAFAVLFVVDSKNDRERSQMVKEARAAGYDRAYSVCTLEDEIMLDGVTYNHYHAEQKSFVDGTFHRDFLVKKDAPFIDESNGKTSGLVIYGKVEGYADAPEYVDTDNSGQYEIVEPYRITQYKSQIDMWAVSAMLVLAMLIEMILVFLLGMYFFVNYSPSSNSRTTIFSLPWFSSKARVATNAPKTPMDSPPPPDMP